MRVTFFCFAKRKSPKKRRPCCACPFAALRATCDARAEGAPQNSLRAARSVQTTAASQSTKCVCPSAHARTPCPALLGTHRREPRARTSTRAIAALGPCRARGRNRRALLRRSRAKRWPVWLLAVGCWLSSPHTIWQRLSRGGFRVAGVPKDTHASCSDSPWLSERRAQRKASSTAHPATATAQVCPFAQRRGR